MQLCPDLRRHNARTHAHMPAHMHFCMHPCLGAAWEGRANVTAA